MNLLVLGGTRFVGRQLVLTALERGHTVTVFTRGQTGDDLPQEVERLHGDRDTGELGALIGPEPAGRTWDACLDVSGYLPRMVEQSAELLKDAVNRYLFVSTVSVYADGQPGPLSEDSALATLSTPQSEDIRADYGALKVICEDRVRRIYGQRATIVRPGLVAGPFDHTGRFTYWALRAARGGVASSRASVHDDRVALAPGDGQDITQVIDVRDLAAFTVHLLEEDIGGTFNAVGEPLRFGAFLNGVSAGVGSQPVWRWVSWAEQERLGATELWPIYAHREPVLNIEPTRARAAGLKLRSLADTARDTLAWAQANGAEGAGPSAEREAELLTQLE